MKKKINLIRFLFVLILLFALTTNTHSVDNNDFILDSKIFLKNSFLDNNKKKPKIEINNKLFELMLNSYSDYKLHLNLGSFSFFQRVPENIQESLELLRGNSYLPLGFSLEVNTKIGKLKTEVEGTEKLNSFKISNDLGLVSLYYDLDKSDGSSSDLESRVGFNFNLDF